MVCGRVVVAVGRVPTIGIGLVLTGVGPTVEVVRVPRPRIVGMVDSVLEPPPVSVRCGLIVVNRVDELFVRVEERVLTVVVGVLLRPKRVTTARVSFPGVFLMVSLRSASRCVESPLNEMFRARAERVAEAVDVRVVRFSVGEVVLRSARKSFRVIPDSSDIARARAL